MSLTHANQTTFVSVLTLLTDIPVSQSEIADVVAFARQGQSYRFVSMVVGSEAIEAAIKQGLVVCEKGALSVPVVPAAEAPVVETGIKNVEVATQQCAKTDIETFEAQDELARQIETCSQSTDLAYRLHAQMLADCLNGDWLDQQVAEAEREQQQAELESSEQLTIPGMKLRNADRKQDSYWIFTSERLQAFEAVKWLASNGIFTAAKPNGSNGNYLICVPRWVRGLLIPS